jgi:peptidoglycan/LPS O-acetylase OafA/YrhL
MHEAIRARPAAAHESPQRGETAMGISDNRQIPSLNGIRALAAGVVFASHAFPTAPIPSSLGVTVFFFLSGFLITTLLRREFAATRQISFKSFYLRRACRILPPMLFMLLLTLALALLSEGAHSLHAVAVAAQFAQLSNYALIAHGSAWLLPHTSVMWSLAVEEHFYLAYPLLLLWMARRCSMRRIARRLLLLCLVALAWRCMLATLLHASDAHIYYASDARFDSLLFGCILGVWRNPVLDFAPAQRTAPGAAQMLLLAAALLLLAAASAWRNPLFQLTLRYTLQGSALLPLFWLALRYPRWPLFAWLDWKPLNWLGVISYGFYLSHPLWLDLARGIAPGLAGAALGYGFTVAFSAALYRNLEKPLLALGHGYAARAHAARALQAGLKETA